MTPPASPPWSTAAIERRRAEGKLGNLAARARRSSRCPAPSASAIPAGRRMAGRPRTTPIRMRPTRVAIVHNGIIENFQELRDELEPAGTQVRHRDRYRSRWRICSTHYLDQGLEPEDRPWPSDAAALHGAFALAILFADRPDIMIGARRGSPLAVGYGDGEMYLGSDAMALAPFTNRICYLDEDDWAVVSATAPSSITTASRVEPRGQADRPVRRAHRQGQLPPFHDEGDRRAAGRDRRHAAGLPQPAEAARSSCRHCRSISPRSRASPSSPAAPPISPASSPNTGWNSIARLPVELDVASEFRYREAPMPSPAARMCHLAIRRDRRHPGGAALRASRRARR